MVLILYKTFTLIEYCLFGGVLTPLLGFIEEQKFKEKKDFQKNLWSSLLLKTIFFITRLLAKMCEMAFLTFQILKFRPPLEAAAYGTRFSCRLLLYLSRLLQNVLRTLLQGFVWSHWSKKGPISHPQIEVR